MHWIIQENIFHEERFDELVDFLVRMGFPHSIHKVVPFSGDIIPEHESSDGQVICIGSYSMRHLAREKGWTPGVFDLSDQDFTVQLKHWGDRMLNAGSRVMAFKDVRLHAATFLRPIDDSKYFAGKVYMPEEFHEWQEKVVVLGEDYGNSLRADTKVQVMAPKEIFKEVRYWVVGGRIVTSSAYAIGGRVQHVQQHDDAMDAYCRECIAIWQPADAFVIDICDTPDGFRIVEINTINAAGFYAGDVQKLVMALEDLAESRSSGDTHHQDSHGLPSSPRLPREPMDA